MKGGGGGRVNCRQSKSTTTIIHSSGSLWRVGHIQRSESAKAIAHCNASFSEDFGHAVHTDNQDDTPHTLDMRQAQNRQRTSSLVRNYVRQAKQRNSA